MPLKQDFHISAEDAEKKILTPDCTLTDVLRAYQHASGPLLAYADAVMGADGPFVMGEKFLMAAFTSKLSKCGMCQRIQETAAIVSGVEEALVDRLAEDIDSSPVAPRLKPVFHFIRKLIEQPWEVDEKDHDNLMNHGWSKRAVFDVVEIAGLFKKLAMMVQGLNLTIPEDPADQKSNGTILAKEGFRKFASSMELTAPYAPPSSDEGVGQGRFGSSRSELLPGQRVTLHDLTKEVHNGKKATVLEYVPHAGNWRVELQNAVVIRVAAENCTVENPLSAFVESSDEEYPPLSETPSSTQTPPNTSQPLSDALSIGAAPENPANRKVNLASSRFVRVQERLAKEYAAVPILELAEVDTSDKTEVIYFKINAKWDKGRKALFAKSYTRLYKDGQRKLRVLILDKNDQEQREAGLAGHSDSE